MSFTNGNWYLPIDTSTTLSLARFPNAQPMTPKECSAHSDSLAQEVFDAYMLKEEWMAEYGLDRIVKKRSYDRITKNLIFFIPNPQQSSLGSGNWYSRFEVDAGMAYVRLADAEPIMREDSSSLMGTVSRPYFNIDAPPDESTDDSSSIEARTRDFVTHTSRDKNTGKPIYFIPN